MKTSFFHKTIALILAMLIFVTSVGVSMDMHFCGNKVKSISFFGEASACNVISKTSKCDNSEELKPCSEEKSTLKKKKCCHNETMEFQSNADFNQSKTFTQEFKNIAFVAVFFANKFNVLSLELTSEEYLIYDPPSQTKNHTIFNQVFII